MNYQVEPTPYFWKLPDIHALGFFIQAQGQFIIPANNMRTVQSYGFSTTDGGTICAGNTNLEGWYPDNAWLVKTDPWGEIQWSAVYGGNKNDYFQCVSPLKNGGFIAAGRSNSRSFNDADIFAVRIDENRTALWQQYFGSGKDDWINNICELSSGEYCLAGVWDGDKAIIIKLDTLGNECWSIKPGGQEAVFVHQRNDGNIIAGIRNGETSKLIIIGDNGTVNYEINLDFYKNIAMVPFENGYLLTGRMITATSFPGFGLAKIGDNGNIEWEKTYGSGTGVHICVSPDKKILVSGEDDAVMKFVRTTSNGDSLWTARLVLNSGKATISDVGRPWSLYMPDYGWLLRTYYKSEWNFNRTYTTGCWYSNDSGIVDTFKFAIVNMPVAKPTDCTFAEGNIVQISINCKTEGAAIRYTLDGTEPNESSLLYTGPVSISKTTILQFRAYKSGFKPSAVKQHTYTLDTKGPSVVSVLPKDNAAKAEVTQYIDAFLDELIDSNSLSIQSLIIHENGGKRLVGKVLFIPALRAVRFIPEPRPEYPVRPLAVPVRYLKYETSYLCTLTTAIKDTLGNALDKVYTWQFTTRMPTEDYKNCLSMFTKSDKIGTSGKYQIYHDTTWLSYDNQNRVVEIREWNDRDSAVSRKEIKYGPYGSTGTTSFDRAGICTGYSILNYDSRGNPVEVLVYSADSVLVEFTNFKHDSAGYCTEKAVFNGDGNQRSMEKYTYAAHGGIWIIDRGNQDYEYWRYDRYFNRTKIERGTSTTAQEYDEFNRLMISGNVYYRYDRDGYQVLWGPYSLVYNEFGCLGESHSSWAKDIYHYLENGTDIVKREPVHPQSATALKCRFSKGVLHVTFSNFALSVPCQLRILDLRGRVIASRDILPLDNTVSFTYPVGREKHSADRMSSGTYIVSMSNGLQSRAMQVLLVEQ